ncbi:MAG: hypothetical protein RIR11_402 [Bacteroidota bacterium]|jgi:hypothetical protein
MRNFIRRHKELGYHAYILKNTIVFLRRIINLSPSDTEKRLLLRPQIQETTKIAEKEWLLSKL